MIDDQVNSQENLGKWYILNIIPGKESKAVLLIEEEVNKKSLHERVFDIFMPVEDSSVVARGSRKIVTKKVLPGYILLNLNLDEELYGILRSVPNVLGFLGGKKPHIVPDSEVASLRKTIENKSAEKSVSPAISFAVGDMVKISDGPFEGFNAVVEEVDPDKGVLKVAVSIFGRETTVFVDAQQAYLAKDS